MLLAVLSRQSSQLTYNDLNLFPPFEMTDSISAAKLAIYIILLQPALYCLFKHGKTGFIGWLYVQIFCVLRIVTGSIGLHETNSSTGSIILNSIGLSPLLLAASGILHEA